MALSLTKINQINDSIYNVRNTEDITLYIDTYISGGASKFKHSMDLVSSTAYKVKAFVSDKPDTNTYKGTDYTPYEKYEDYASVTIWVRDMTTAGFTKADTDDREKIKFSINGNTYNVEKHKDCRDLGRNIYARKYIIVR